mmetsp:Transcript_18414/g.47862  ORF Transcript_18414/g.47862 Transcript_18414/m.47862 type:complete len:275 (-) Transcript_18414:1018-1842(-)
MQDISTPPPQPPAIAGTSRNTGCRCKCHSKIGQQMAKLRCKRIESRPRDRAEVVAGSGRGGRTHGLVDVQPLGGIPEALHRLLVRRPRPQPGGILWKGGALRQRLVLLGVGFLHLRVHPGRRLQVRDEFLHRAHGRRALNVVDGTLAAAEVVGSGGDLAEISAGLLAETLGLHLEVRKQTSPACLELLRREVLCYVFEMLVKERVNPAAHIVRWELGLDHRVEVLEMRGRRRRHRHDVAQLLLRPQHIEELGADNLIQQLQMHVRLNTVLHLHA